jgi:hypothetical protein
MAAAAGLEGAIYHRTVTIVLSGCLTQRTYTTYKRCFYYVRWTKSICKTEIGPALSPSIYRYAIKNRPTHHFIRIWNDKRPTRKMGQLHFESGPDSHRSWHHSRVVAQFTDSWRKLS